MTKMETANFICDEVLYYMNTMFIFKDKNRYGILNSHLEPVCPAKYVYVHPFIYEYTIGFDGESYQAIDKKGNIVYESIYPLEMVAQTYCIETKNEYKQVIDLKNKLYYQNKYASIVPITETILLCKDRNTTFIFNLEEIRESRLEPHVEFCFLLSGKYVIYDKDKRIYKVVNCYDELLYEGYTSYVIRDNNKLSPQSFVIFYEGCHKYIYDIERDGFILQDHSQKADHIEIYKIEELHALEYVFDNLYYLYINGRLIEDFQYEKHVSADDHLILVGLNRNKENKLVSV